MIATLAEPAAAQPAPARQRQRDRTFVLGLLVGFCVLTALPTVAAVIACPSSQRFTGLVARPDDLTYYVASERGAAIGSSRANRFTSEVGAPGPVSPLYGGLGRIERAVRLPPGTLFHLPQVLAAPILVLLVWWIGGLIHPDEPSARRWAAVLALLGAGAAAVTTGEVGARSTDGTVFESTAALSVATFPHFAVAYVGLVLAWGAILSAVVGRGVGRSVGAGALGGLLLAVSHGFLLLPVVVGGVVLTVVLAATGKRREAVAVAGASGAALVVASPFLLRLAREQAAFERLQGHPFPSRPSDAWWTWAVGEPILAVLLVVGAVALWRRGAARGPGLLAVALWLGLQGALVFLPITVFQRRFSEGIMIPAGLLAGVGAAWWLQSQRSAVRWGLGLALVLPSASVAWRAGGRYLAVDRPTDDLARALGSDDVVLAGVELSWRLPALSAATTYLGRTVETLHYRDKEAAARTFLADPLSPGSRQWLRTSGVTAIVLDDQDPTLPPPAAAASSCFVDVRFGEHLLLLRPVTGCPPPT